MIKYSLVLALLLTSCASKDLAMRGELTSSTSTAKLDVSAELVDEYSDDYNIFLQVNFQSRDGKWIRVDKTELDLSNSDNQPYNIVVGKDLVAWAEAKAEEKKMREHNKSMGSMGVAAAGGALAVIGILTDSKELAAAGGLTLIGATGYDTYNNIKNTKNSVQGAKHVPETHLYAPFTIPSMSLSKRWILINAPTGRIGRTAKLKLTTVEGEVLNYNIYLAR
ncbi:hypothetical protein [Bdellovibrio bacteriovorus]|uniref:hypothetical protein n=1 Tax=Bdellovibrio TaxID=958 RepID=UPI0035A97CCE